MNGTFELILRQVALCGLLSLLLRYPLVDLFLTASVAMLCHSGRPITCCSVFVSSTAAFRQNAAWSAAEVRCVTAHVCAGGRTDRPHTRVVQYSAHSDQLGPIKAW